MFQTHLRLADALQNYTHTLIAFIILGTGSSLVFTASVVVIPERFSEHRVLAAGLSMSGAGSGTVVWPWITK